MKPLKPLLLALAALALSTPAAEAATYISGGVAYGHPSPYAYRHHRYGHYPHRYYNGYYPPRYVVVEPPPVYVERETVYVQQPAQQAAPASEGRYCREYTRQVTVAGKKQESFGQACMQPDGSWEIIN